MSDEIFVVIVWAIIVGAVFFSRFITYLNEWTFSLVLFVIAIASKYLVNYTLLTIRLRKAKKGFFKKKRLFMNGAIIISVEDKWLEKKYTFVEDDEQLENGKPYGITVAVEKYDADDGKVGERVLLLYGDDGQWGNAGDVSLQIMKITLDVQSVISLDCNLEKQKWNKKALACFPHPNGITIRNKARQLEQDEKKEITDWFVSKEKKAMHIMLLVIGILLLICLNSVILMLKYGGYLQKGFQGKVLAIYSILAVIFFGFLTFFVEALKKTCEKNACNINSVQEVLYKTGKVAEKGQSVSVFYEWNGEKFVEREYKNISFRAEYGTVFYKYLNEHGMAIFVEKK